MDKEFVILFTEMDENKSWLLGDNIENFSDNPEITKAMKTDPNFIASNKMASINGFIYGNLPGLDICQGDKVSWHIIGVGEFSDIHNRKYFSLLPRHTSLVKHRSQTLVSVHEFEHLIRAVCRPPPPFLDSDQRPCFPAPFGAGNVIRSNGRKSTVNQKWVI